MKWWNWFANWGVSHPSQWQHPEGCATASNWLLAWGRVENLPDAVWQDRQLAVFLVEPSVLKPPLVVSPSGRFVVIGDLWLSQRSPTIPSTTTDLQWVAACWEQEQDATFNQLIGMFGLAVWDRERQTLWLGRDRVGARTLYYTTTGQTRWIAPRLRSLTPYRSNELDLVALRDYLCCAFVPGERTLWNQVRELRPGTMMQFPEAQIKSYWTVQEQIRGTEHPLVWHGQQLRTLLESVIQDYLPIHEPVGVFLSGGLDSSSVTALAAKYHTAPIHTYSLHFGAELPNELAFSSLVADHCQTHHHILEISLRQLWERLPEAMIWLDDPIGDPLTVPNLLMGQLARETVEIVLNGEGGDPCFGGPKNQPMLINQLYQSVIQSEPVTAYLLAFQKCAADLPQLLKPDMWRAVQAEPSVFAAELQSQRSYLNSLMTLNILFKGADHILTKVNNLTQATGLQGRSPLFDPRVVECSMQIPPDYKLSGVEEKAVLKAAIADLLPNSIVHRPKSGMLVPVQLGFREHWQRSARSLLLNRKAAIAPYLNQSLIRDWLAYQGDAWGRYGVKLWLLASLELWLRGNGCN